MITNTQERKTAALYCRFSREEDNEGDCSNSIKNQKVLLENYAMEHSLSDYEFYVDDGYSGTMFDRPDFKRMINDIETGTVNTVIVKDMSRFGRNYLQVGMYTEMFFVENGIRFISVCEGIDTAIKEDDFAPFRNIMNEWYAKDISNKVKASLYTKGKNGQRLTTGAIYGYIKDENSNWIVDKDAAETVKMIFDLYEKGVGMKSIAGILSDKNIPTPTQHKGKETRYSNWNPQSVRNILFHREYCGDTVNFRTRKISFKSKKRVCLPQEDNMIFLDTHEAIISREQFENVQAMLAKKRRQPVENKKPPALFKGLLKCKDCGASMQICRSNKSHPYICSTYRKIYNRCTSHYIREDYLAEYVKQELQRLFELERSNQLSTLLYKAVDREKQTELKLSQEELEVKRTRISEIDNVLKNLYEDKISGVITPEMFTRLYAQFESEQQELKAHVYNLSRSIGTIKCDEAKINQFVNVIKKYSNDNEVFTSNEKLLELIDKIVVGDKVDEGTSSSPREIEIYFNFIGNIKLVPQK